MRIVIDMQGAQTESRFRGIGRYTLSFAQAVARKRGEHDVVLALSGLFPDTVEPIRHAFHDLLPQENIRVWHAPGPVCEGLPGNDARRDAAELIREAFLASLAPDVIHVCSLFEGYVDDAVSSIGRFDTGTPVTVTLHDLIPLLNRDHYLTPNPRYARYYLRKVEHLKKATAYLAISEFSRQEGLTHLSVAAERVFNTLEAADPRFRKISTEGERADQVRRKFGLEVPFILYSGGADERKNLPRLIRAFAALPRALRETHVLLVAGKIAEADLVTLRRQVAASGLHHNDVRFAGYVSDDELVILYNLCKLFVFPSWHEGFGLPALEAMACGASVIGANTSSLPEVIGLDEALFDPFDVTSIVGKIARALEDEVFREALSEHGLRQAKRFSWDETAARAISAWEAVHRQHGRRRTYVDRSSSRARLVGALAHAHRDAEPSTLIGLADCVGQNECAGIERQLLLDVSELVQHDAATGVQRVVRSYLRALLQTPPPGFRIEPVYATRDDHYRYARRFTQAFLGDDAEGVSDEPVRWVRGDVFFCLDMQHHVQLAHVDFYRRLRFDGVTVKFLVHDLLPIQLADLFKDPDARALHERWLEMIGTTDGAICVSKSTADALQEWLDENAIETAPNFQLTWVHNGGDIEESAPSRGVPPEASEQLTAMRSRPSFLCVATLEPRKRQQQILHAVNVLWDAGADVNLVLVGRLGWKSELLADEIRSHREFGRRLFWLQGISDEYLEHVYAAASCLLAASLNEGFGLPIVEAARHELPVIARDIPVFREIAGVHAFYFSGHSARELADALTTWLALYKEGCHPASGGITWSTWHDSAERLKSCLIGQNYPRRQLLVDVSELVLRDAQSGIQRVVRNVLKEWLRTPPRGYRVEPVYASLEHGYRYARRFTTDFHGHRTLPLPDDAVEYAPGDVFFGLDMQPRIVPAHQPFYQALRRQGVRVEFLVHDLLCIRMPEYFPPGSAEGFLRWLETVAEADGAVCVSRTVAEELSEWVGQRAAARRRPFRIRWSHNGADLEPVSDGRLPSGANAVLERLRVRVTFLMVGTVEPRKGHAEVLDAFERLWHSGLDVNLAIVGKQGWMVDDLVERLRSHPQRGSQLFWLEGIGDDYLTAVYAASGCLIAASYGEGFGLPLIEAAQHKLPIIARDIPVFREVAGQHAFYFRTGERGGLEVAIRDWLDEYEQRRVPNPAGMRFLSWRESAAQLMYHVALSGG